MGWERERGVCGYLIGVLCGMPILETSTALELSL